jgi:Kef-type K+ transport system membrane component KefB
MIEDLKTQTHDFVSIFLLPIFFAYSGLQTQIGLLNTPTLVALTLLVIVAAVVGKFGGAYLGGRLSGLDSRTASAMGWLMNTRGLTELVILNVGLSLGVLSPTVFAMFVIMAVVTTLMSPLLLERAYPRGQILTDDRSPRTSASA